MHELVHWSYADISREDRIEQQTRRETALKLISMIDYMSAEFMYDGDIYQIACELDVIVRVIKDYQQILAKHALQQYLKRV